MLNHMLVVATQVLMLFLMIGVGWICAAKKILTNAGADQLSRISLNIITPCVIINSLQQERNMQVIRDMGICILAGMAAILLGTFLSCFFFAAAKKTSGACCALR